MIINTVLYVLGCKKQACGCACCRDCGGRLGGSHHPSVSGCAGVLSGPVWLGGVLGRVGPGLVGVVGRFVSVGLTGVVGRPVPVWLTGLNLLTGGLVCFGYWFFYHSHSRFQWSNRVFHPIHRWLCFFCLCLRYPSHWNHLNYYCLLTRWSMLGSFWCFGNECRF